MMYGLISHWRNDRKNLPAVFGKAFDFCAGQDFPNLTDGRYDIDGDNVYAMLQTPKTETEGRFETHGKYCDIQLLLAGREKHLYAPGLSGMSLVEDALQTRDVAFYTAPPLYSSLVLEPGHYTVYFPGEPHAPCCAVERTGETIRKIVFKILWGG